MTSTSINDHKDPFSNLFRNCNGSRIRSKRASENIRSYQLKSQDSAYAWDLEAFIFEKDSVEMVSFADPQGGRLGEIPLARLYTLYHQSSGTALPGGIVPSGAIKQLFILLD